MASAQATRKRKWLRGESVQAMVVETHDDNNLLVDVDGYLFRVVNRSLSDPQVGDPLFLQVASVDPLELKIVGGRGFTRVG